MTHGMEGPAERARSDMNVSQFPICQVEHPYITDWPPVGNIVMENLLLKLSQGCWGSPFCNCALHRQQKNVRGCICSSGHSLLLGGTMVGHFF
jgi:hypothetical protein